MKSLICSLLLPALMAQSIGCYSSTEISFSEMEQYKKDKLYLTTSDLSEYILLNESNDPNVSNWSVVNDSLILSTDRMMPYSQNAEILVKERTVIPSSSIKNLHTDEFNSLATSGLIIGILVISVYWAISTGTYTFMDFRR